MTREKRLRRQDPEREFPRRDLGGLQTAAGAWGDLDPSENPERDSEDLGCDAEAAGPEFESTGETEPRWNHPPSDAVDPFETDDLDPDSWSDRRSHRDDGWRRLPEEETFDADRGPWKESRAYGDDPWRQHPEAEIPRPSSGPWNGSRGYQNDPWRQHPGASRFESFQEPWRQQDPISEGVRLGYQVVEEQIRQGQRFARQWREGSYGPGASGDDLWEFFQRLLKYSEDLARIVFGFWGKRDPWQPPHYDSWNGPRRGNGFESDAYGFDRSDGSAADPSPWGGGRSEPWRRRRPQQDEGDSWRTHLGSETDSERPWSAPKNDDVTWRRDHADDRSGWREDFSNAEDLTSPLTDERQATPHMQSEGLSEAFPSSRGVALTLEISGAPAAQVDIDLHTQPTDADWVLRSAEGMESVLERVVFDSAEGRLHLCLEVSEKTTGGTHHFFVVDGRTETLCGTLSVLVPANPTSGSKESASEESENASDTASQ